jgi:hypothetical protein
MSSTNLIGLERAKLAIPDATTSDDRTIDALIAACSEAIQKYCGRHFALRSYDEILDGCPGARLLLPQYPIHAVESVRCAPTSVLEVQNTSTAVNQQARVMVTSTGLTLVRIASGVRTVDTSVTFAANATLQAVATAINVLGNGWSARVAGSSTGDYGLWPSQDLYVAPSFGDAQRGEGAFDCRGVWAGLSLHVRELSGYCWDARGWLYRRDPWCDTWPGGDADGVWHGGPGWWRVQYTAGHAVIPDEVQEACAGWVSALWWQSKRDPRMSHQSAAGFASSFNPEGMPASVRTLVTPYRKRSV